MNDTLTVVEGIRVGHWSDFKARTGCTVILCENGAVAGVDVRGAAPGTRETDLLRPTYLVEKIHAICLSGGSAFGLAAADGVMRYLEERGVGFPTRAAKVPIVPAAILYDLNVGHADVRPTAEAAYIACVAAHRERVEQGAVGAGTGATVGKILGADGAMAGGVGSAAVVLASGVMVAALAVANAVGDVVDFETGQIIAGARRTDGTFANTMSVMLGRGEVISPPQATPLQNTTLVVVATNARLSKEQVNRVAIIAQDGVALAVRPAHTMFDGDVAFALSLGDAQADVNVIGVAAVEATARAIMNAVRQG